MPLTHIHILSNIIIMGGILLFDSEIRKWSRQEQFTLFGVLTLSNLIDIDHLLSTPIYDPNRCSINNHHLHSWYSMPIFGILMLSKNSYIKYLGANIAIHIFLDYIECII